MTFGEKLMNVRLEKGYSINMLASLCHIKPGRLEQYEQSIKIPRRDTIRNLSDKLKVSWFYLLSDSCHNPRYGLNTQKYGDYIWDHFGKKDALRFQSVCIQSEIIMEESRMEEFRRLYVYQTLFDSYCKSKEKKEKTEAKGGAA